MDQRLLLDRLSARLGARHVLTGQDAAPSCTDWRGLFHGAALAVLRPATAEEVAACVSLCAEARVPIVPQGGNTGLCGGATPRDGQIVLSLTRMNRLRDLDPVGLTMIAEAGLTLQAARAAAEAEGAALPLSIGSQGSAQIGGLVSTNAGGIATLRHGSMRDLVLGLEVVLPDGQIWHGLRRLTKDNTGYALRHLFIGAEGTLGIVTAACLRLASAAATMETALAALPSAEAALRLLSAFRERDAPALHAFEYISGEAMKLVVAQMPGCTAPFAQPAPCYALIDFARIRIVLEAVLSDALAAGTVLDAVVASSQAQRATLWQLRELQPEAEARAGPTIKNDISVPVAAIPSFLKDAGQACHAILPTVRIVPFGHLGDGNIHFNLLLAEKGEPAEFLALSDALIEAVTETARQHGGSFSAEHGVGQLKTGLLQSWRGGVELALMRKIKTALDPANMLNPGKIFPD